MLVNDIVLGAWLLALLVFRPQMGSDLMFVFPKPENARPLRRHQRVPLRLRALLARPSSCARASRLVRTIGVALMATTTLLSLLAALATVALIVPPSGGAG